MPFHWFIDPIKDHYFDFEGRVGRREFWMFALFYFLISVVIAIFDFDTEILGFAYVVILFFPYVGLTARRLHDTGRSGWWQLIGLIPIIGFIILVVWLASAGDDAANDYGEVPPEKVVPEAASAAAANPGPAAASAPVADRTSPAMADNANFDAPHDND